MRTKNDQVCRRLNDDTVVLALFWLSFNTVVSDNTNGARKLES